MLKYNLHVTQVPDHKAQVVLARIIVGADSMIPLQQAIEMAANPPLLLFHNLERKELEQHIEQLTGLGVEFDISEIEIPLDPSDVDFGEHKETPEPEPAPPPPEVPPAPPKPPTPLSQPGQTAPAAHAPVHVAAEHEYHKHPSSGYRVGAIDGEAAAHAAAMKAAEETARKKSLTFTIAAIAFLLIIGVVTLNLPKNNKITIEKNQGFVKTTAKQEKKSEPAKAQSAAAVSDPDGEPRVQPTARQKQQANTFLDSAKANDNNLTKSVAFYKMAISFNRQNLAAWQGLLQAYRELHMDAEAHEAEKQMRAIFGNETMSVGNLVKSYGELVDTYVNADGTYMVEYKTTKSSKVDILRDIFGMTRAVRAACNCHNISVRVSVGPGKEVTAHSTQQTSVHSLSEFMRQAEIVWQE